MASVVLDIIGLVSGAAALVPFISELLAPDPKDATNVRVILGTSTEPEGEQFDGNTPGASLWDFQGHAIGFTPGTSKKRAQGSFIDITINPTKETGNVEAEYLSITNGGNDAICIVGISLTFPDGAKAGFSSNVAAQCGAPWANSRQAVVGNSSKEALDNPKCVWIDRDGSGGVPYQGMGVHLPSFSNSNPNLAQEYKHNPDFMCKSSPRFRMYTQLITEDPIFVFLPPLEFIKQSDNDSLIGTDADLNRIIGNPGGLADPPAKRSVSNNYRRRGMRDRQHNDSPRFSNSTANPDSTRGRKPRSMAERVIISNLDFNSARELCESKTSWGHSFVSLVENLFCDMKDKTLYYTCSDKVKTCCFDHEAPRASFRACQKDSERPETAEKGGTSTVPGRLRVRQADDELDPSWTKGDMTFDSVQRW